MADDLEQLKQSILGIKTNPWDNLDPSSIPRGAKLEELNVAAKQKYAILNSLKADKERDAASWSSQLGVRHMPVTSGAVDLAASLVSGASRTLGHIGTALGGLEYTANDARLSDADRASMQKFMQGTLSKEEESRMFTPDNSGMSPAARYRESQKIVERVAKLRDTFDITSITNASDRNAFHEDIGKVTQSAQESFDSGDTVTGLAKLLVGGGKSILTNPKAVSEYVAENLPQLFMGAAGTVGKAALTASNIGYASDEFVKGIEAYSKANNGALPTDEIRNEMALKAASLAIAENVGEFAQLGAISKAKQSAEGFLKTVGKATGTGALNEGLTEAYQTGIENNLQGKEVKWEDVYEGGLIGAASGGAISGIGAGLKRGAEIAVDASNKAIERTATDEAVKAAIESGDTSAILNPESPTYAPHRAVDVAIAKAEQGELTTEEKTATFDSLSQIRSDLEAQKKEVQTPFEPLNEEGVAQAQEIIAQTQEELAGVEAQKANFFEKMLAAGQTEEQATTKVDGFFGDVIKELQTKIDGEIAAINKKPLSTEEINTKVKEIDDQLSYLSKRRNDLGNIYSRVKPETVNTLVEEVAATKVNPTDVTAVEESVKKASKIITFAMANTDNLSSDQANKLASSEVGTTQEQRTFFALHVKAKEAELAAKDIKLVSANVFKGDDNFMGLDAYRRDLSSAAEANDKKKADKLFSQLENFSAGHISKLKAMYAATNNKSTYIVKDETGKWEATNELTKAEYVEKRKLGTALEISSKSINLISAVKAEAVAINALVEESRAGLNVSFKGTAITPNNGDTSNTVPTKPVQKTNTAPAVPFTHARTSENGFEVSSRGDKFSKQFSPLIAKLSDGRTIEEAYQLDVKGYRGVEGFKTWQDAKSLPPKTKMTQEQSYKAYLGLWEQWAQENPKLIEELRTKASGKVLTDTFANTSITQARALSDILNRGTVNAATTSTTSTTETTPISQTGVESSQQVTPTEGVSPIQTGSQETTSTAVPVSTSEIPSIPLSTEITNGTQTTETKQTEAQGQEQQQGQATVVVQESSSSNYKPRTVQNANSAGVTVAIANDFTTAGERLTKNSAGNKYIPIGLQESATEAGTKLAEFMKEKVTSTLNVAGNSIHTINTGKGNKKTQAEVNQHVFDLISAAHKINPITQIVSGGQTGVDIAGAIAARALGIPAVITLPKGFKQRGLDGKDRANTKEAIEKQIEDGVASLNQVVAPVTPNTNNVVEGEPVTTEARTPDLSSEQVEESVTTGTTIEGQDLFGTDPKELTDAIKKSEATIRKVTRKNPKNLWSVLRNRMVDEDLLDTFGEGWKKTKTMLKGKAGKSLSTLIADGVLDDFLDDSKDLKNPENESAAVEFIKEALRTGQHLTYATQFEIQTEGLKIEAIRRELESLLTIQEITDEIEYTEGTEESRVTEGVQKTEQKSSTGDTARDVAKQDEEIKEEDLFDDSVENTDDVLDNGASIIDTADIAEYGDDFQSPWLMADGRIAGSYGDHIAVIGENESYSDHMLKTGDIRSSFFIDDIEGYVIMLHIAEGQKLTPQQLITIETIVKKNNNQVTIKLGEKNGLVTPEYRDTNLAELKKLSETPSKATKPKKEGKLTVFNFDASKMPIQEIFEQGKSVLAYITQKGSQLPLVQVKNFFSLWTGGKLPLESFIKNKDKKLNENQQYAVDTLKDVLPQWISVLKKNIVKKNLTGLSASKDLFQQLINEDGTVDENVLTAMAVAGTMYVTRQANYIKPRTYEDMVDMTFVTIENLKKYNSEETLYMLSNSVTTLDAAQIEMGRMAAELLGLSTKGKHVPENILPQLSAALGVHVFNMLSDPAIGLLKVEKYKTNEVKTTKGIKEVYGEVVTFKKDDKEDLHEDVTNLRDTFNNTDSIIERAFGAETSPASPTTTPVKFNQKFAQGTRSEIPTLSAEQAQRDNDTPMFPSKDMIELLDAIGVDAVTEVAGAEDLESSDIPANQKDGAEAKKRALKEEIVLQNKALAELHSDSENDLYDLPFHTSTKVLSSQRLLIETRLNPMTSKIHRWSFSSGSWKTTITKDTPELIEILKISIASGLGFNADTNRKESLIEQLEAEVQNNPDVAESLELLNKFFFPESSEDRFVFDSAKNRATLIRATQAENMQSLRALVSWVKLRHAISTNFAEPLVTDQMFGIDGKVNGTALAHISLGISDMDVIGPQTGFYEVSENGPRNFVDYASQKGLDVYQNVFTKVQALMSLNTPPKIFETAHSYLKPNEIYDLYHKTMAAVHVITGDLYDSVKNVVKKAGRDMVKEPITALHFGSATASIRRTVGADFVNSYYKALRKAHKENGGDNKTEAAKLIAAMTALGVTSFRKGMTLDQLMNTEMSKEDLIKVKESVEESLGGNVGEAFEMEFSSYLGKRNAITNATSVAFAMYQALKADITQAVIKEGMADGTIAIYKSKQSNKEYPYHDLNTLQKDEINRRMGRALPVMHTVLSKRDNNIKAGLFLGKKGAGLTTDMLYQNQVSVLNPDGSVRVVHTPSEGFTDRAPGATPASAPIHSLESAIMQTTRAQLDGARNINDEIGVGIGQAKDAARLINKQTADLVFEYSPLVEILSTVTEIATVFSNHPNMLKMLNGLNENYFEKYTKNQLANHIKEGGDITTFVTQTLNGLSYETLTGEVEKYTYLSKLGFVDQYPMEGAQYDVPQEYRDAALRKSTAHHIVPLRTKVAAVIENINNRANKEKKDTSFPISEKKLGDASLYAILASLKDTLPAISQVILKDLEKILPTNLRIKTISEADAKAIEGKPEFDSNAWFSHNKETGENIIYIVEGKMTPKTMPEAIYHELIHAALFRSIDAAAVSKNPELKNLHDHLERIRNLAIEKDTTGAFTQATVNNHELVSWGLANADFRKFLSTIGKSDIPVSTGFPNALKEFIAGVLKFLMPKTFKDSAVRDLLEITVGLIADAKANPNRKVKDSSSHPMVAQGKQTINSYTTFDIFNALATPKMGFSADFNIHLNGLLSGIVRSLRGPFGSLTQAEMTNQTITPLDVWANSVVTGKAPLVSKLSKSGVRMTAQERFVAQQVEAVMNDAMTNPDVRVSAPMQELIRLFNSAKTTLKPQDFHKGNWSKATQQNKDKAQALYDFLFNVKATNGKSDYLGNFVALGLSNEKVNVALNIPASAVKNKDLIGKSFSETLTNVFEYLLNLYTDLASKTNGNMQMNEKLYALTSTLVNIEAKKKNVLKRQLESKIDPALDAAGRKMSKALRGTLSKLLKHPIFSQNKYSGVRLAASSARIVLEDRVPVMMDAITKMRNEFLTQKHGLAMNMFNDVKGYGKRISAFIRMATSLNAEREHLANQLSKVILKGFENNGEDLTSEDHAAITGGLLRTGAHVFIGKYDMKQISEMLTDSSKLDGNIKVIEKELLKRFRTKGYYFIHQSKGLAALMVKGNSVNPVGQLTNALMISREANGSPTKLSEEDQKDAEKMIDEISSLYALQYRELDKPGSNAHLAKLIDRENARGEKTNGILEVMALQAKLNEDVKNTLFSGSEVMMRKGYLPEIVNPHTSFEIGGTDTLTAKDYADRGYEEGKDVYRDHDDAQAGRKAMYVLRDGAPSSYVSGAVQLDSNKAKGSKVIGDNRNLNSNEGIMNASELARVTQAKLKQVAGTYSASSLAWNPMQVKEGNFMVPLFNENMGVVNWRYEMSHDDRDAVLERDNRINEVISTMAATTFGKETAAQQNKAVVAALHEDYKKNYNLNSPHFIYISALSEDGELRDMWKMLPYQMKQDIKEITGDGKGMWVRKQYVLPVFGYRKYSLSELWTKEEKLNMVETAFKTVVEWLLVSYATTVLGKKWEDADNYAKRAYIYVRRGQRAWEEVVAQVKDIVVIRTGTVMLGNIISNFSLLKANGVPFSEMIKNHHVAIKAYRQYDQNIQELFELETERDLGFLRGNAASKESRINQLQDAVNNSPIKKLIDAGLRPSIVEDLADIDDQYSYKSAFVEKMDQYVDKVNPTIRNIASQVLVTKNSELYKALSKTTQMSDFVARYVLFEHLTKRRDNPMTEQEAVFEVSEAFINYDIPMAKGLQFIDDMGFTPFIKYFFRIQRVLFKTAKDHPIQMMSLVALNHFYSSLPLVTDSSFISHIGNNPFRSGAGQIFNVWDDTLVLDQLSKLVK